MNSDSGPDGIGGDIMEPTSREEGNDNEGPQRGDSDPIPFQPTEVDVVATKIRTWNSKHPGNQFYTNLVQAALRTTTLEEATDFRSAAQDIHRVLCVTRNGRFLKLPDNSNETEFCVVMSKHNILNKVVHALKTAKKRQVLRDAGIIPPPYKKAEMYGMRPFKVGTSTKKRKQQQQAEGEGNKPISPKKLKASSPKEKLKKSKKVEGTDDDSDDATKDKDKIALATTVESSSGPIVNNPAVLPKKTPRTSKDGERKTVKASKNNKAKDVTLIGMQKPLLKPVKQQQRPQMEVAYRAVLPRSSSINTDKARDDNPSKSKKQEYFCQLISKVCSQPGNPAKAHYVLDQPQHFCSDPCEEPDWQRFQRLQLRQRFAAAVAIGMTPIEFARSLLKLLGGELQQIKLDHPSSFSMVEQKRRVVKKRSPASSMKNAATTTSMQQSDGEEDAKAIAAAMDNAPSTPTTTNKAVPPTCVDASRTRGSPFTLSSLSGYTAAAIAAARAVAFGRGGKKDEKMPKAQKDKTDVTVVAEKPADSAVDDEREALSFEKKQDQNQNEEMM